MPKKILVVMFCISLIVAFFYPLGHNFEADDWRGLSIEELQEKMKDLTSRRDNECARLYEGGVKKCRKWLLVVKSEVPSLFAPLDQNTHGSNERYRLPTLFSRILAKPLQRDSYLQELVPLKPHYSSEKEYIAFWKTIWSLQALSQKEFIGWLEKQAERSRPVKFDVYLSWYLFSKKEQGVGSEFRNMWMNLSKSRNPCYRLIALRCASGIANSRSEHLEWLETFLWEDDDIFQVLALNELSAMHSQKAFDIVDMFIKRLKSSSGNLQRSDGTWTDDTDVMKHAYECMETIKAGMALHTSSGS